MTKEQFETDVAAAAAKAFCAALRIVREEADAEDAVSDATLYLLQNRKKYNAAHKVEAWLVDTAKKRALNRLRWNRLRNEVEPIEDCDLYEYDEDDAERQARARHVIEVAADKCLTPAQKICLTLQLDGFKQREISSAAGIPVGTVGVRQMQARRALAKELTQ